MKKTLVLLLIVMVVFGTAITPGIAVAEEPNFDPDEVEIASFNGEDPDGVNELAIDIHENISIELAGVDEFERPLMIEIGGEVVSHLEEPKQKFRPRSTSNVTTGEQTLQVVWEDRDDRTIVAETQVAVTDVSLDRDDREGDQDDDGIGFDPNSVEIASIAGQDADQVNEFAIDVHENISIELDGVDDFDRLLTVEIGGNAVGNLEKPEQEFRPRSNADVPTGEQTLQIVHEDRGNRTIVAETEVQITDVTLEEDAGDVGGIGFDPDSVEIASIAGQDANQVNEFAIDVTEDLSIELDGVNEFDRPLFIEIGGDVVSHLEEPEQEIRPRSDTDVTKGEQTLQIVYEERGERTIVAETQVKVTEVVLERDQDDRSGLGFDPETVEIDTVAGQDAAKTNEIEIVENEEISIELDGVDDDMYAMVELDGEHIGSVTEEDNSFRPRPGRDVSEGEQTLTLVREREGERIVIAETQVDVTHVDLTQDDPTQLEFDPDAVSLDTVNGKDATEPLELALTYDEKISFSLDGVNVKEHGFLVNLDGTTIGMAGEGETAFRPRTDADVSPGEHTLEIVARGPGKRTPVAETTVVVTEVNLDRDEDRRDRPEFDSESVSIVSVNDEPADQRNELALKRGSPLTLQLDGVEFPDRGFHVEIGGEVVGIIEGPDEEIRIRRNSDVTTGEQSLQVVWKSTGDRTVLAETPVKVTEVDLDRRQFDVPPEDVELEIVSVNGEPAEGVVVTEHDLRGETPIELEVDGLAETDREPNIRYKGETVPSEIEGFEIEGDELSLEHLPRVEDGDVETLQLVERTGPDDFHVYDSVKIEYRHAEDEDALVEDTEEDDGGVVSNLFKLLGGGGDEAEDGEPSDATEGDQQGETDEGDTADDDGGVISTVRKLFGL